MELKQLFEKLLGLETEKKAVQAEMDKLYRAKREIENRQESLIYEHQDNLECSDSPIGRTCYHHNGHVFYFIGGIGNSVDMIVQKATEVES